MTIVNPERAHKTQMHHMLSKILNIMLSATPYQTKAGNSDSTSCNKPRKTSLSGCRIGITALCVWICFVDTHWSPYNDRQVYFKLHNSSTGTLLHQETGQLQHSFLFHTFSWNTGKVSLQCSFSITQVQRVKTRGQPHLHCWETWWSTWLG